MKPKTELTHQMSWNTTTELFESETDEETHEGDSQYEYECVQGKIRNYQRETSFAETSQCETSK